MLEISPIVLFVYNRPWHTAQTLNALLQNELAGESPLFVYADGAKQNATKEQLEKVAEVRKVIRSKKWCKQVQIIESDKNKGLAHSIISGVTEIVNKYGKVIVLEDDIVTSRGFLKYMNDALDLYSGNERVGCIHAWNYDLDARGYNSSTFFLKGADCWGWATWKRSWDLLDKNGAALMENIVSKKQQFDFERRGTHKFIEMLQSQINGTNDSWAIRWHASLFLANKYCLQPTKSIVKNIGLDSSGIHCGPLDISQNPIDFITLKKITVKDSEWFYKAFHASKNPPPVRAKQLWNSKKLLKRLSRLIGRSFSGSLK